jgi:hypothetical protein
MAKQTKKSKSQKPPDVTDNQIRALRDEAAVAGDEQMVEICNKALVDNSARARTECARVIAAAQ